MNELQGGVQPLLAVVPQFSTLFKSSKAALHHVVQADE
ncbi:hypothetical protein M2375_000770 [Comamonas sp. BIGb0152]|nr:hypothetical protein [Comamonas sp. BIGb0152]